MPSAARRQRRPVEREVERLRDAQHRLRGAGDGAARLAALVEVLQEQGFMPDVHVNGVVVIHECNCPFPEAVKRTRRTGASAERVTYIPDGFAACTYEFSTAALAP